MSRSILNYIINVRYLYQYMKNHGKYPAGHYHSPIPRHSDVIKYLRTREKKTIALPDIDLNKEFQFELLKEFQQFYDELPFPEKKKPHCRYYYDQVWFCYSDAIFLYCFLRKHAPAKIVEIGSGFSSAVILDTIEKYLPTFPEVTFIDPHPQSVKQDT